jgi:hypothetical protein
MGERNSTAQGSGEVISYSKDRFLLNHHQEKDFVSLEAEW